MIYTFKKLLFLSLFVLNARAIGQEYKIQFSHIPIGQGITENDSIGFMSSIGSGVTNTSSSDSFSLGVGFLESSQNAFSEPPTITDVIFPSSFGRNQTPSIVEVRLYDLNGIKNVKLELQKGGSNDLIQISMERNNDDSFQAVIPDSVFKVKNFRARIVGTDNMGESTFSNYYSSETYVKADKLSMNNDYSHYPSGILKNQWRLLSWPAKLFDNSLAFSELKDGHVFYRYSKVKKNFVIAESIELNKAYWFRHEYVDPVIFEEDSSIAIPLSEYSIPLSQGWNLIGSPFSFPVTFKKDSLVGDLYTYGKEGKEGWDDNQNLIHPWNGYVVYAYQESEITIFPFIDGSSSLRSLPEKGGWDLNIYIEDELSFDYSAKIGNKKNAKDGLDMYDSPSIPHLKQNLKIAMDLNGNNQFNYSKDIRNDENFNGVWNFQISDNKRSNSISLKGELNGVIPQDLILALVDIPKRRTIYDFTMIEYQINKKSNVPYELKLIAGDEDFVSFTVEQLLNNIPTEFSLGQNYPNPFNPITTINYSLPERSDINISVYNVVGQEIAVLLNMQKEHGYHSTSWNGIDRYGKPVSSGVYFARMTTKNFSQTKKMLLLK